jgi:hypothetical protein
MALKPKPEPPPERVHWQRPELVLAVALLKQAIAGREPERLRFRWR